MNELGNLVVIGVVVFFWDIEIQLFRFGYWLTKWMRDDHKLEP